MDINKTLFNEIASDFCKYDCYNSELEFFLLSQTTFSERQKKAIDIIENIMTVHNKKNLLNHITILAKIEHEIKELESWVRDHVVHALLSFILGIYINEKFLINSSINNINDFQWKLAGLFHDIGYPIQIASDLMKIYHAKPINDLKIELGLSKDDIYYKTIPVGLEKLFNNKNSLDLFQECFVKWDLQISAHDEFDKMIKSNNIDHGIISSLSLVYIIDLLYQKFNPKRIFDNVNSLKDNTNWNQEYFERDVIQAGAAIFLHNLSKKCFKKSKINRNKAPLAFLLKLSDCLQEWERPSRDNINGYPSSCFDIKIENKKLILTADIPSENKQKINNEIHSILIASDIKIK